MTRREASRVALLGRWLGGLTLALSLGCASIAGLDELVPATGAGGVGGGGTGGGGTGGTAAGGGGANGGAIPSADWTGELDAVYLFEIPANPGADAAGHDHDLTDQTESVAVQERADAPEGSQVAYFEQPDRLESQSGIFDATATDGFTFGGWFKTASETSMTGIARLANQTDGGYWLRRAGSVDAVAQCAIRNGTGQMEPANPTEPSWPGVDWVHVVCRYSGSTAQVSAFANGLSPGPETVTDPAPSYGDLFIVGVDFAPFYVGWMDEIFYVRQALTDESIRRIWACGIDGAQCTCGSDGVSYADCGRAEPSCGGLVSPCDAATPIAQ